MSTQILINLFVFFLILNTIISVILDVLNIKSIASNKDKIPSSFKDQITWEDYQKSISYSIVKARFSIFSSLLSLITTSIILFSGLLEFMDQSIVSAFNLKEYSLHHSVLFISLLVLCGSLLNLPLKLYSTFKIEAQFGFNNQTLKGFITDQIKATLVAILIGIPFLYAVFWFLGISSQLWWFYLFLFITAFQIILLILYPIFIAPLFNKFESLEEGELKSKLFALSERVQFGTSEIFVMDGSKRSGHSNAYFTGFGKYRRIVLYDTLINHLSANELEGVLAHEMGHYKRNHIYKMLFTNTIIMLVTLYLLSIFIYEKALYQAFDVSMSSHMGLFLFMTVFSTITFFLTPIQNIFSRKYEYEADAFAISNIPDKDEFANALVKLTKKNLSNLTPHPWYSSFYYSHPSTTERISALN